MHCKLCKKEFKPIRHNSKYCSTRCYNKSIRFNVYNNAKNEKAKREIKKIVNSIRVNWDFIRTHFPDKAIDLKNDMEKEEDTEFIEFMLNGFKDLKKG